jgi:hypothetical protein
VSVFDRYMELARNIGGEYAAGYCRGLRRYHDECYGTDMEHAAWMTLAQDLRADERGQGYLDGIAGRPPRHQLSPTPEFSEQR